MKGTTTDRSCAAGLWLWFAAHHHVAYHYQPSLCFRRVSGAYKYAFWLNAQAQQLGKYFRNNMYPLFLSNTLFWLEWFGSGDMHVSTDHLHLSVMHTFWHGVRCIFQSTYFPVLLTPLPLKLRSKFNWTEINLAWKLCSVFSSMLHNFSSAAWLHLQLILDFGLSATKAIPIIDGTLLCPSPISLLFF